MDKYSLENMGQLFVDGRVPSHNRWASIRTVDEDPLKKMGQVFVLLWTNTLWSGTWGKYSSVDE